MAADGIHAQAWYQTLQRTQAVASVRVCEGVARERGLMVAVDWAPSGSMA